MMRLEVRSLSVDLGTRRVLQGIDLSLEPGCLTALIGPNGAGKTTLLRAMAGLVRPSAGDVVLNGSPVVQMRTPERARAIAYLPQGGGVA